VVWKNEKSEAAGVIQVDETHEFASTSQAPALARDAIAKFARKNGVEEARVDIARLLGSELVTNAFLDEHPPAGAAIRMRLAATAGTLWIAVSNAAKTAPQEPLAGLSTDDGYGLQLVETAASRWGVHSNGKTHVWFELDPDAVAAHFAANPFRLSEPQARQLAALRIEHLEHGISVSVEALTSSHRVVVALQAGRLQQLLAIAPSGEREDDVYIQEQLPGSQRRR
jgi:anti-sigma regulatory factor (Ser/Thr protein kinase)